ncbi:flagellar hook-basal body complex protein FliE [Microbulbifer sp. ANSA003]|uniref:flagellar hook-basal body complex protein FliE n=1 Tax=unclassified Microbulbifer TaxID=2619833 RepID=UPI00403A5550
MSVNEIDSISYLGYLGPQKINNNDDNKESFIDVMSAIVRTADDKYRKAEELSLDLAAGNLDNVHEVIASISKAKLNFDLVAQVRNKLLEGYQEVMKMQI